MALHAAVWTIAAAKIKRGMAEKAQRVPMTCRWLSQFAEQRRALKQPWADYLARLCKGAEVLPFRKTASNRNVGPGLIAESPLMQRHSLLGCLWLLCGAWWRQ